MCGTAWNLWTCSWPSVLSPYWCLMDAICLQNKRWKRLAESEYLPLFASRCKRKHLNKFNLKGEDCCVDSSITTLGILIVSTVESNDKFEMHPDRKIQYSTLHYKGWTFKEERTPRSSLTESNTKSCFHVKPLERGTVSVLWLHEIFLSDLKSYVGVSLTDENVPNISCKPDFWVVVWYL